MEKKKQKDMHRNKKGENQSTLYILLLQGEGALDLINLKGKILFSPYSLKSSFFIAGEKRLN